MRTARGTTRFRAFTLLELLVAVAILSAVFALVASLWSQASGWGADIERQSEGLRLQRVVAMMKDQWSNRRTSVALGRDKMPVVSTDTHLTFTTATPILFPDWPLVVATYRLERETEIGRLGLWRIVYEETRVSSARVSSEDLVIEPTRWDAGRDARGRPVRDRMVLLDGMPAVSFERFGPAPEGDDTIPAGPAGDSTAQGTTDDPQESDENSQVARRRRAQEERREAELAAKQASGGEDVEVDLTEAEKEARRYKWRPMEMGGYLGLVPSIRLVGEYDKERFACVFVVLASR